jgi:phage/plasmid-associated DNA primase
MFISYCGGANGKSVFVNTLYEIDRDCQLRRSSTTPLKDKFQLGSLKDKLLNVATEIQSTAHLENSIWRKLSLVTSSS